MGKPCEGVLETVPHKGLVREREEIDAVPPRHRLEDRAKRASAKARDPVAPEEPHMVVHIRVTQPCGGSDRTAVVGEERQDG